MIFERLTDRAREVLVNARLAAQQCHHASIEAPHLLVGILRNPDTKGCEALNHAGLRYLDVLSAVQRMYQQTAVEPHAPPVLTAEGKQLLDGAMRQAVGDGQEAIETVHLALACSRPDAPSSIKPFVLAREQGIRDAARSAQKRSVRLEADLLAQRPSIPPERSLASRMDALRRANEIRVRRAQLKLDLKSGRVSIDALLREPPDYVQTAKLFDMLLAVPKFGRVKVNKLLTECRIAPSKTIGGLSQRQRDELIELL